MYDLGTGNVWIGGLEVYGLMDWMYPWVLQEDVGPDWVWGLGHSPTPDFLSCFSPQASPLLCAQAAWKGN